MCICHFIWLDVNIESGLVHRWGFIVWTFLSSDAVSFLIVLLYSIFYTLSGWARDKCEAKPMERIDEISIPSRSGEWGLIFVSLIRFMIALDIFYREKFVLHFSVSVFFYFFLNSLYFVFFWLDITWSWR